MLLRALEPEDVDILYDIENERSLWAYSDSTIPYSRDALQAYILTCSNDIFQDKQLRLVAEVDGKAVGLVDLCNFSPLHGRAEVSIALLPDFRCKGLGTEVLRQISIYSSRFVHLHQLYAYVAVDNLPSLSAFAKAGFEQVAELRDWIRQQDGRYVNVVVYQKNLE